MAKGKRTVQEAIIEWTLTQILKDGGNSRNDSTVAEGLEGEVELLSAGHIQKFACPTIPILAC